MEKWPSVGLAKAASTSDSVFSIFFSDISVSEEKKRKEKKAKKKKRFLNFFFILFYFFIFISYFQKMM
jgi:hypothetical protein